MRSGAYREPISIGLQSIDPKLSTLVSQGDVRLAITGSITGNVTIRRDLIDSCLCALEIAKSRYPEEAAYYMDGLLSGRFVPVMSAGVAYIAVGASAEDALKTQAAVLRRQPEKVYAPGELFIRSV